MTSQDWWSIATGAGVLIGFLVGSLIAGWLGSRGDR